MPTRVSRIARTAAGMQTAGTHSATSHQRPLGMMVLNSVMNALVSVGVLFIFQLPAMTVLRYFLFMIDTPYMLIPRRIFSSMAALAGLDVQTVRLRPAALP